MIKKSLKTDYPHIRTDADTTGQISAGSIPFLFRQKSLLTVSGHTLRPGGLELTRRAVDFCGLESGHKVLDAGCGYGMTARYLADSHGMAVTGTDMAADMLREARDRTRKPIRFVQSQLPALPFRSGRFKAIFCECVFSLVPDKQACLKEFRRVLATNGRLILTDLYIPQRYAREQPEFKNPGDLGVESGSCLGGATPLIDQIRLIEEAGLTVELIEDHTRLLRQLAGQLIFKPGSLDSTAAATCRKGRLKPGYGMIVAARY